MHTYHKTTGCRLGVPLFYPDIACEDIFPCFVLPFSAFCEYIILPFRVIFITFNLPFREFNDMNMTERGCGNDPKT